MERPDYIPFFRHVVDHQDCTNLDAVVYGYIYWLTKLKNEKCFASNETLAQLAKSTPTTIRNSLTSLEKAGFIQRKYEDNNPHKGRLEIIPLLSINKVAPTGDTTYHPQMTQVAPTDAQSKSIELEQTTSVSKETRIEVYDEDKPQKKESRTKDKLEVFRLFSSKAEPWMEHKTQKEAALRLHTRGIVKLKRGLEIMAEYKDEYCPQALTPWEYESKLPKLNEYRKKHDL